MANMSYCRFENTLSDLRDCYNALGENGLSELSETEKRSAIFLIGLCKDISDDFADEANDLED